MERIAVIMGKMHSGGKKNLVMEYYRHINKEKIQFDFICDDDSNAIPFDEIKALGGKVFVIPPYQDILKNMSAIYKLCKKNKYKIVHGYNGTMNLFAMLAAKFAGVPVRINESISMAHSSDKKTIIKNILRVFSKCGSTHYMSNGEACGRWQFGNNIYNSGKVAVFKTVIDTGKNAFIPIVRRDTRKELGIEDNLVIGHIGRLTEQKNTLFLIDIVASIVKKESTAKLLLIGDGNLRDEMFRKINKSGLSKSVIYLGRREDIQKFYNSMDCFILPSLYEGLPVTGLEAEACGLPVFFSTEIPRESSPCDELGHFISLGKSADEWAEKIIKYTKKNIDKRKSYIEAVKAAGFDSGNEAKKLLNYYENILKKVN